MHTRASWRSTVGVFLDASSEVVTPVTQERGRAAIIMPKVKPKTSTTTGARASAAKPAAKSGDRSRGRGPQRRSTGTSKQRREAALAALSGDPFGLGGGLGGRSATEVGEGDDAPTERQVEIYAFIRDKIHSRGFGPTVREIGQAFKIRSPNGVVCHLKALERKGLITRGRNMSRAIELVNEPAHLRGLPLAGWVAAGTLRPAEEQSERIDFEGLFNRDDHFVLKVMGDSMIDAQIADGDWVVIQKKHTAHSGDIVVAQTEDGEATLKQWFPERDRIRLQPANATMKPIYVRNARVLGVLVGVVRKT